MAPFNTTLHLKYITHTLQFIELKELTRRNCKGYNTVKLTLKSGTLFCVHCGREGYRYI